MSAPMNAMELDEVRRWAESHEHNDESTTVAATYLRLLATVADVRRMALEEAAKVADAGAKAAKREMEDAMRAGNKSTMALDAVAHDVSRGIAFQIRALLDAAPKGAPCPRCSGKRYIITPSKHQLHCPDCR